MKEFTAVAPESLTDNVFSMIGKDWMLITAGSMDSFNTMTASWGGMGVLWHKKVCFIFIRPQRYTYELAEKSDFFTLSFFTEGHRNVLNFCGSNSGRDVDKVKKTGITPVTTDSGGVTFSEARLVLECRKIYFQDFDPENFIDPSIENNYQTKDYHRMYVGEVTSCYVKE